MSKATRERFERWSRLPTGLPTVGVSDRRSFEERQRWTETDFNWHVRRALGLQGYRALHIREADVTGPADLLVYRTRRVTGIKPAEFTTLQTIDAWLELKMSTDEKIIRPAQKGFMREHWEIAANAMFVMRNPGDACMYMRQGNLQGRTIKIPEDPYDVNWEEIITRFKNRRLLITDRS